MVKEKTSHNRIDFLQLGEGNTMVDKGQIASTIIEFYRDSLGSSSGDLLNVDNQALRVGNQISHQQALELIRSISMMDVEAALKGDLT